MGEFFFHLDLVWFWLNMRIKENGESFSKLHVCIFVITWAFTFEFQGEADKERQRPWKGLILSHK